MDTKQDYNATMVHVGALALALTIFAIDLTQPLGAAIGILYVLVIVLGLWTEWRAFPLVAAVVCSALLVIDIVINWTAGAPSVVYVNRPLIAVVLVATAALVTRFKHLQRQSRENVEQLADLKRAIDQAAIVATTDVSGRITYVNDKFCEISKYSREELLGQDHRIVNSRFHSKEFIRELWRTIAHGRVWHGEIRNRAKDGSYYWVNTTIVPFLNPSGKPYQYVAIRSDITRRKAAEERLAQQAALAQVGQLAAVVAHEVRNPLAGIKGAVQVLISRRPAGDPEIPIMKDVVARIDSLGGLINDLMVFARPRPAQPATVELRPLLEDAMATLRRDPMGAHLEVGLEGPDLTLQADAEMLKSTVLNLMLNAAQAMGGRGRLTLATATEDGRWRLEIRDTGPGIPDDIRDQIFEPFFTTKSRGGGLGLPIARRTAELHGGTVFTLAIPLTPSPIPSAPPGAVASSG